MARIRSIKPDIHTDDKTGTLSDRAFRLFVGLLNLADDFGVLAFSVAEYKAKLFPYAEGNALDVVGEALFRELLPRGLVVMFSYSPEDEGPLKSFLWVPNFLRHQKVDHPSAPLLKNWKRDTTPMNYAEGIKIGSPNEPTDVQTSADSEGSHDSQGGLGEGYGSTRARKGKEGIGGEGSKPSSPAPQDDSEFGIFWTTYPARRGKRLGKDKALAIWHRLTENQRQLALRGAVHYRTECDSGTLAKDAFRWLRDSEWVDWQEAPPLVPTTTNGNSQHPGRSQNQINADAVARRMGLNPADTDPFGTAPDEPWRTL